MKKYIYLILAMIVIIPTIIMSGYALQGSTANVKTLVLEPQDMDNTVTSSGELQYRSGKAVKCEFPVYFLSSDLIDAYDADLSGHCAP